MPFRTTIRLRGVLGKRFGETFSLALDTGSPAEAIRAISAQRPGFREFLATAHQDGLGFRVRVGDFDVLAHGQKAGAAFLGEEEHAQESVMQDLRETAEDLSLSSGRSSIEIIPVPMAAGKAGAIIAIVVGVILVAVTAGAALGVFGAGAGIFGSSGFLASNALLIGSLGVGIASTGVTALIASSNTAQGVLVSDFERAEQPEELPSFSFSGPVNTRGIGRAVPVWLGEGIVGSHMVAFGIHVSGN